jgi:hypothetical protein
MPHGHSGGGTETPGEITKHDLETPGSYSTPPFEQEARYNFEDSPELLIVQVRS